MYTMSSGEGSHSCQSLISGDEWRFVIVVAALAMLLTSIPYVLGAVLAPEDRVFGGFVYALEDCYSYLAKMRQGAEGGWLFHIAYTAEPHMGTLFFPFHLLLGKIAALLPGGHGPAGLTAGLTAQMVWVYHVARVIFGMGLLLTVYRFLAEFTERVAVRRVAWLMVTFGGGLGWLILGLGQSHWLGTEPLDLILPEGFTFLVLYAFPHIALARTLLLGGILFLLRAWSSSHSAHSTDHTSRFRYHVSRVLYSVLAGSSWLLMGLVVPFYVPVAWAVTGALWVALSVHRRRVMWREGWIAGLVTLVSSPIVVYSAWVFTTDPVYAVWSSQNLILSPHPLHYLAAYGVVLILAALAIGEAWRAERPLWVALGWVAVVPLLVYLPFNLQRRLVEGVQVPLSLLASIGLLRVASGAAQASGARQGLITGVALVALSLTNVLLVVGNCRYLRTQPVRVYRDAHEIAALDWLQDRVEPDDVVLTSYRTGNYLPARVRARVFLGHGPETVRFGEKKALVARFFDATTDDAWRRALLEEYGIDYVFWGPVEREVGDFDPRSAGFLREAYDGAGYVILEVDL